MERAAARAQNTEAQEDNDQKVLSARSAGIFPNILSYFESALKQSDPELSSQRRAVSVLGLKKKERQMENTQAGDSKCPSVMVKTLKIK